MTTKQCRKCDKIFDISFFSKHSGTKDKLDNRCKNCVKLAKDKTKEKGVEQKLYPVQALDKTNSDWQVGKHIGSILERVSDSGATRYEARIKINGKAQSKSFAHSKYNNKQSAYNDAELWLKLTSNDNNLIKNKMRFVDDYVEIQVDDKIVLIDNIDTDICQQYNIFIITGGGEYAEPYACIIFEGNNKRLHNFITGNTMSDHINRNTLDNRRNNIRSCDHKINNNNRGMNKKYVENPKTTIVPELNINEVNDCMGIRYVKKDNAWQARIKQNSKETSKMYSVRKFGYEQAKIFAMEHRRIFNEEFNCSNGNLGPSDPEIRKIIDSTILLERMRVDKKPPKIKELKKSMGEINEIEKHMKIMYPHTMRYIKHIDNKYVIHFMHNRLSYDDEFDNIKDAVLQRDKYLKMAHFKFDDMHDDININSKDYVIAMERTIDFFTKHKLFKN